MKKLILQLIQDNPSSSEILQEHQHLFNGVTPSSTPAVPPHNPPSEISTPLLIEPKQESEDDYEDIIEDIVHLPHEEDTLSLEKKEKELIIKALKKNNNKRKYAARDLGISERTLYRKIKQYEIESL